MNRLYCLVVGLLFAMLFGSPVAAASATEKSGAWNIACNDTEPDGKVHCALLQNSLADDPAVGISVVILYPADGSVPLIRILAPLGVLLPSGLNINVDGKFGKKIDYLRCFKDGCYAEEQMKGGLLQSFIRGNRAIVAIASKPGKSYSIPIDLTGFSKGLRKLR